MKHISPPPRFSRLRALPLCAVFLGLLLVAGWSGCERVTSSLSPQSTLSPDELPKQGNTVLPKIGNVSPDVRVVPPGGARKSGSTLAGSAPELNLDRAELRAYIESVADIHDERYISLFVKADSSGGFYHYAYESLNFHPIEEERSKGERELFVYVRPNKTNDGVFHLNLGLLPRTRSAFEDYQRWLLPFHANSTPRQKQGMKDGSSGSLNLQFDSTEQTCYFTSEFVNLGDNWWDGFEVVDTEHCVAYTIDDTIDDDLNGGGGICWSCEYPGGGGSSNPSTGCDGDPNAVTDDCGRCVGGNTGRLPAPTGADCEELSLPCLGDVVKNPEITSPGASGKNGGRFRPCVEGVSPGGASGGWLGPVCTDEDKAVRNNGLNAHHGLDITCNVGDPIYAPFDLNSADAGSLPGVGYGNFMRGWTMIDGVEYSFGITHLQSKPSIPPDGKFKKGDIIGYCGRSGIPNTASGRRVTTHVHIEMGTESTLSRLSRVFLVDPEPFLLTQFSSDTTATPTNPDPCNQN